MFSPDSNLEQGFQRFRLAFAKDFRFVAAGEPGFFTHLAAGFGLDVAYTTIRFQTPTSNSTAGRRPGCVSSSRGSSR